MLALAGATPAAAGARTRARCTHRHGHRCTAKRRSAQTSETLTRSATTTGGPAAATTKPPTRTWRSGVFDGYGPTGDLSFALWRGSAIQTATDYIGSDNWSEIEDPVWAIDQWSQDRSVTPDLSVAMWPATGGSLAVAASGAYNGYFAQLAQNLVAAGLGGVSIRLGWEFNGTWYRWSVHDATDAADFAQAWREIVTAMRAVPGADFSFDWCPTLATGGVNPALAYPGDAYVSDIGLDVYDWSTQPGQTAAARWNAIVNDGYGLAWQARFAAATDKPIAVPEWGVIADPANPTMSGGDDPLFVENMYDWFASHDTDFEDYFDSNSTALGMFDSLTSGGLFPKAAAVYRSLYDGASERSPLLRSRRG